MSTHYHPVHRGETLPLMKEVGMWNEGQTATHRQDIDRKVLETSRPQPQPPGRLRRLKWFVLDRMTPEWSKGEAALVASMVGAYAVILGGYTYYESRPGPEGDYKLPADYYVQLKVPKHGGTFEDMMERYGSRHYHWTHRQADQVAEHLVRDLDVQTTDPDASSLYVFDADQPLAPGETVQFTRYMLRLENQLIDPPTPSPTP